MSDDIQLGDNIGAEKLCSSAMHLKHFRYLYFSLDGKQVSDVLLREDDILSDESKFRNMVLGAAGGVVKNQVKN